ISLAAPDSCFWSNETNQFPYALAQPVAPASSSMDEDAATSSDRSHAAPPDVECAVCVGVKRRAQQACLECVASYCETHLDLHNTLHAWKRHKLVEPGCLQERICPEHDKPLQVFCRTDQLCVCHLCLAIKHKGHEVVAIKKEVHLSLFRLVRLLCVVSGKASAEEAMERSEGAFAELMLSMEGRRRAVTELIRAKEEAVVKEARELVERARQEIDDLKRRAADLERLQTLSHTNDDICFLTVRKRKTYTHVFKNTINRTFSYLPAQLTIDPNTVHDKLHLSKAMELTAVHEQEPYPSHTARFVRRQQALCREVLCGAPCYWEVECGAGGSWLCVAVSYKGIPRNGRMAPLFGRCPRSWALRKRGTVYEFWQISQKDLHCCMFTYVM
uniref:B box-type domain-containing protein n=1 Tax=Electrophorus electricus TaxID=8005 RepID=A0AAY5EIV8_ELEEL